MTPRTFVTILIKILGIYLIMQLLYIASEFISSIIYLGAYPDKDITAVAAVVSSIVVIALYIYAISLCMFKTDFIIDKLALDKGFSDEKLEFNIHRSTILKIATIVIGGVILIDSIPLMCKEIYLYIEFKGNLGYQRNSSTGWLIYYFVKAMVGYFMLTSSRPIVNYIESRRKK